MSDHWNSIANLLKTPSLGPTKKTEGASKPAKAPLPPEPTKPAAAVEPPVEAAKAKPEPSRLRSSWDAVATFFGVATPDQGSEKENISPASTASESSGSTKSVAASGRKSKPSMWGDPVETVSKTDDSVLSPRVAEVSEVRDVEPPRRGGESSDRGRSRDRGRGGREAREARPERAEISAVPQHDDEVASSGVPERRSQRQQPRRGRQADVRADSGFVPPVDAEETELNDVIPFGADLPERIESDRPPRGRGPRGSAGEDRPPRAERAPRPDRGARPEKLERPRPVREDGFEVVEGSERKPRTDGTVRGERPAHSSRPSRNDGDRPVRPERSDRPERAPRPERSPRPENAERGNRGERAERPARAEGPRSDGPRSDGPRTEGPRADVHERSAPRERTARHDRNAPRGDRKVERVSRDESSDRRPGAPVGKKPSGFGAGIHDDDSFGFVDDLPEIEHEFEPVDDFVDDGLEVENVRENVERESRPKRRRGRGRRSESRSNANEGDGPVREAADDRDLEDDDSSEFISRNSRIPSWQDTIGTLVTVNMENHQRNQSGGRPPRGRGPRRDR